MSVFMMLAASGRRELFTETFTANASWPVPAGVTSVDLLGKGAAGMPASSSTRSASTQVHSIQGHTSGSGAASGSFSWSDFQQDNLTALAAVNGGGGGTVAGVIYNAYPNSNTYDITLYQDGYSDAIAGTASIFTSPGWKSSGAILGTDYGFSRINYLQSYTISPTTGAPATAFGKTFPGGTSGAAAPASYSNVSVTSGQTYPIVVPAGGSVTISYLK